MTFNLDSRPKTRPSRPPLLCSHYHREGHDVTTCFQVVGYLEWWVTGLVVPVALSLLVVASMAVGVGVVVPLPRVLIKLWQEDSLHNRVMGGGVLNHVIP